MPKKNIWTQVLAFLLVLALGSGVGYLVGYNVSKPDVFEKGYDAGHEKGYGFGVEDGKELVKCEVCEACESCSECETTEASECDCNCVCDYEAYKKQLVEDRKEEVKRERTIEYKDTPDCKCPVDVDYCRARAIWDGGSHWYTLKPGETLSKSFATSCELVSVKI